MNLKGPGQSCDLTSHTVLPTAPEHPQSSIWERFGLTCWTLAEAPAAHPGLAAGSGTTGGWNDL